MVVKSPEKIIETFVQLILHGYKIGYMETYPLEGAYDWFGENFNKHKEIANKLRESFVPVVFDDTI
jgi:hypothetical protein